MPFDISRHSYHLNQICTSLMNGGRSRSPDATFLVVNDNTTAFSLDIIRHGQ